jgi:hypothetical protein
LIALSQSSSPLPVTNAQRPPPATGRPGRRGRATGGRAPTVAEFVAIAAIAGSPFGGIAAWNSDVVGGVKPTGTVVTADQDGTITDISQAEMKSQFTHSACVYDPALAPKPAPELVMTARPARTLVT